MNEKNQIKSRLVEEVEEALYKREMKAALADGAEQEEEVVMD